MTPTSANSAMQAELGLPVDPSAPLFGFIGEFFVSAAAAAQHACQQLEKQFTSWAMTCTASQRA